jgi:predicted N-acetyltransferase YhbS
VTDVRVREATTDDADPLATVLRSAYRENRDLGFPMKGESVSGSEVADWIREHRVYVAETGGEVVGGVRVAETDPDRVKLSRLGVREDWKGEGVGSRLLAHAEDAARERGYATIWLTTPPEHPHLPAFYRRGGYEESEPWPLEFRDYDEVVMKKPLR